MPLTRNKARQSDETLKEEINKNNNVPTKENPVKNSSKKPPPTQISKQKEQATDINQCDFNASNGTSTIACTLRPTEPPPTSSTMIFTHGAGGDHTSPAISNFAEGFATQSSALYKQHVEPSSSAVASIICFKGSMNLKSRISNFHDLMAWCGTCPKFENGSESVTVLGGRSMGARAAVLACASMKQVTQLVLVSYPLQGQNGEIRDRILMDIDESVEVLFLSGDRDHMCDLDKLNDVRGKMKARSWLVSVEGADHGMNIKQKSRTRDMQFTTGRIAADWVNGGEIRDTEGDLGLMEGCSMKMNLATADKAGKDEPAEPAAKRRRTKK